MYEQARLGLRVVMVGCLLLFAYELVESSIAGMGVPRALGLIWVVCTVSPWSVVDFTSIRNISRSLIGSRLRVFNPFLS